MGNRSQVQWSGAQVSYESNALNQYSSYSTTSNGTTTITPLSYDLNGNLSSQGNLRFSYDDADRLSQVIRVNAQTGANEGRSEFVYDGLSRKRISREYSWDGTANAWVLQSETRRIYDGLNVIQERDGTNSITVNYTRGADLSGSVSGAGGIGGLLARSTSYGHFYYHYDGSGNVVALTDTAQSIVAQSI